MTEDLATRVLATARVRGWHIATAESCTGGMVGAALTEIAGSSDVFDRGYVTYSNAVNSVGMLRLANTVCEKTNDTCQTFILYKDMTVPGILERFYKKMQERLGVMMTKGLRNMRSIWPTRRTGALRV